MTSILFICHGNICRSPMAESIFTHLVRAAGVATDFTISSAAISQEEIGNSPYPDAVKQLAIQGIALVPHRAV